MLFPSPKVLFFPLGFVPWGKVLVRQHCIYHFVFLILMINVQIRENIRLKEKSILQRNRCVVLFPSSYFCFFPIGFLFWRKVLTRQRMRTTTPLTRHKGECCRISVPSSKGSDDRDRYKSYLWSKSLSILIIIIM